MTKIYKIWCGLLAFHTVIRSATVLVNYSRQKLVQHSRGFKPCWLLHIVSSTSQWQCHFKSTSTCTTQNNLTDKGYFRLMMKRYSAWSFATQHTRCLNKNRKITRFTQFCSKTQLSRIFWNCTIYVHKVFEIFSDVGLETLQTLKAKTSN